MKVALVTSWLSNRGGGVKTVVESLSLALANREIDVQVLGLSDEDWITRDRLNWAGSKVSAHTVTGPSAFGYSAGLSQELQAFEPDIVHSHGLWMYPSVAVFQWATRNKMPYIVSTHGMLMPWALKRSKIKKMIARRLFEDRHLNGASRIHALTEAESQHIRAVCANAKTPIIPNGVELPGVEVDALPIWFDTVPIGRKIMLFLGRLSPQKNLTQFIDAWAAAAHCKCGEDWHLIIAGWDQFNHQQQLLEQVKVSDLSDRVTFVGPVFGEKKISAYKNADAFVLPSISEGLPMTILEAWSYKLPVLMTDACNIPEGFDLKAAFHMSDESDQMLADLTRFFGLRDSDRRLLGCRGYDLLQKKYLWTQIASDFEQLYIDVASEYAY